MVSAIRPAQKGDMDLVRVLFREYADWLQFDYCFQAFEQELADLPGACVPPKGGLWLADVGGEAAGIAAVQPLTDAACELKRVWLREAFRGRGLGKHLVLRSIEEARSAGYRTVQLETLTRLTEARALYAQLGFQPVPAEGLAAGVVRLALGLNAGRGLSGAAA